MPEPTLPTGALPAVILSATALDADDVRAVLDLVADAALADGGDPLAEDARLALRGPGSGPGGGAGPVLHLLARRAGPDGDTVPGTPLTGYAQARPTADAPGSTVELLVHPRARGFGLGRALAERLRHELGADAVVRAWSHTDSPAAAALAAGLGLRRSRELWRMERALDAADALPPLSLPDGVALRPFEPGRDEEAWLRLNARAFAGHPEQGGWGRGELDARTREPWFDPADLLLLVAVTDADHLLAAHWTKVTGERGEVYVLAVDPSAQGQRLGGVATLAGLHHLKRRGARVVDLYVDGDNLAAQHTYARLGFRRSATDVVHSTP